MVALGLALFVAPFASGWPDGLEHVAGRGRAGPERRQHLERMMPAVTESKNSAQGRAPASPGS